MANGTRRSHFQEELSALEQQALGGLDMVVATLDRTLEALRHQDIELASIVDRTTTTASTGATSRSSRASCRCSRSRRRWPPICGSSPRCCT